jgi:MoaA/NifB/PqqE/SkfB family radical SAM enzyme
MILLDPRLGKNFCYAPWTNIHINTRGEYKTCCAGQTVLGNLHDRSIESILTNPALDEIKTAALNNHSHSNCGICERQETNSGVSERAWYHNIATVWCYRKLCPVAVRYNLSDLVIPY